MATAGMLDTFYHMRKYSKQSAVSNFLFIAALAEQMSSLSYFDGDFARWCCGYEIRFLLEQSNSLELF